MGNLLQPMAFERLDQVEYDLGNKKKGVNPPTLLLFSLIPGYWIPFLFPFVQRTVMCELP